MLSTFGPDEQAAIRQATAAAAMAIEDWLTHGLTYVMDKYNRKGDKPEAGD